MHPSHYNPQECDCLVVIIPPFTMSYAIIMVPYCSNTTEISHNVITLPYHALINNVGSEEDTVNRFHRDPRTQDLSSLLFRVSDAPPHPPGVMIWVRSLPTRWKERTDSWKLSADLYTQAPKYAVFTYTNMSISLFNGVDGASVAV